METKTTFAAGAAALAGCAMASTGEGSGAPAAASAATGLSYCQRDKLVVEGCKLACNWAKSTREACEGRAITMIAAADVASGPDKATICADGTPLVRVATK